MKSQSRLRLANKQPRPGSDEPSRQDIAMAEIEQNWRENNWTPISEPRKSPTFNPDEVLHRAARYAVIENKVSLFKRIIRWMKTVR